MHLSRALGHLELSGQSTVLLKARPNKEILIVQSTRTENELSPVLTVSQLTTQIADVLEGVFDNVCVVGEVSNAKIYPSGHWYFSLKDKDATLPCVCFRKTNASIKFKLEDGLMMVVQGKVSLYPPKGAYQLIANALEPVGIGEWQLAFEQLKTALEKEGLLDPARKRTIPIFPRKVGVVTSTAGAAIRDILSALARRNKNVNVIIAPARVQGDGSADEVAQAIISLQEIADLDVIIVARGGGSIEDLWSFNTEVVARAVASSRVPVVSGVGHETDITICDLVADLRAPTPTAAAELVAQGSKELFEKHKYLQQQLIYRTEQRLAKVRRQLERLNPYSALLRYQDRLHRYQLRVAHGKKTIERAMTNLLAGYTQRLRHNHEKLQALAPMQVLKRGFAILRNASGSIVRRAEDVVRGEEVEAILSSGSLRLRVEESNIAQSALSNPTLSESVNIPSNEVTSVTESIETAENNGDCQLLIENTTTVRRSKLKKSDEMKRSISPQQLNLFAAITLDGESNLESGES